MMQLKLPEGDPGAFEVVIVNQVAEEAEKDIMVTVHPGDKPPILIKKHGLVRWSEELEREIECGELPLIDGFIGNWEEVKDCISLLQGNQIDVTFENIKVFQ